MADNIYVKPSDAKTRVNVKTEVVDDVHIPVYIAASPDGTLIDDDNPMAVLATDRTAQETLNEILIQSKLQTEILKEAFNSTLTERDIPCR